MQTASEPDSNAFRTCSGCSRPVQETRACRTGQGQAKSGTTGRWWPAEVAARAGRAQLAHRKTVIAGWGGACS